jgi:RNA polymerase sigma-70 factor (ECF subfamily)
MALSDHSAMELAKQLVGTGTSPSAAAAMKELCERLRDALDQLPQPDSEVLVQRYLEQLSSAEIAEVLGISEATVNMRHMRALERMRALLDRNAKREERD